MTTIATTPDRFIVVDGNVYWIDMPTPSVQPNGREVAWLGASAALMHAPMTSTGQIAWEDGTYVDAVEPEQVAAIVAALTETICGIALAHAVA